MQAHLANGTGLGTVPLPRVPSAGQPRISPFRAAEREAAGRFACGKVSRPSEGASPHKQRAQRKEHGAEDVAGFAPGNRLNRAESAETTAFDTG